MVYARERSPRAAPRTPALDDSCRWDVVAGARVEAPFGCQRILDTVPGLRDPDVRLMLEVRDDNAAAFEELMLRIKTV